jgi:hypothetical protein
MSELVEKLRKAADWGEDEFDVLSPQDAAAAADRIEALEAENFKLAAGACTVEGGLVGDEHGHFDCSLKARIEALERELAEAREAERERCAKVAEEYAVPLRANVESSSDAHTFALNTVGVVIVEAIAAAIRNGERG